MCKDLTDCLQCKGFEIECKTYLPTIKSGRCAWFYHANIKRKDLNTQFTEIYDGEEDIFELR